jgi:hypothetical protein
MLTLKVSIPASSFETTIVEMSGAAGSSPVESVKVTLVAASVLGDAGESGLAIAAAGRATHAVAINPRSAGDRSRPTAGEATDGLARRQGRDKKTLRISSVEVPRLASLFRGLCSRRAHADDDEAAREDERGELPLRSAGRIIALTAAVAAFAVGPGSSIAPAQQVPPGAVARCNALASTAAQLQTAHNRLASAIAAVQQRVASGNLNGRQLAAARFQLAVLGLELRLVDSLLVRVQASYQRLCGGSAPPSLPPPSDPAPPPAPPPPPPPPGE